MKILLPQQPGKEPIEEGFGEVPAVEFSIPKPQPVPEVTLETKVGKTKNLTRSLRKLSLSKQKEPHLSTRS